METLDPNTAAPGTQAPAAPPPPQPTEPKPPLSPAQAAVRSARSLAALIGELEKLTNLHGGAIEAAGAARADLLEYANAIEATIVGAA